MDIATQLGMMHISVDGYGQLIRDQVRYLEIKQMYRELPRYQFMDYLKVLFDGKDVKTDAE